MKEYIRAAIFLAVCLGMMLGASRAVEAEYLVRVGVYENKPLVFRGEDGEYQGLTLDLVRYIAEREGWRLEMVPGTWPQCLDRLRTGAIDLQVAIAYSEKRARIYDFNRQTVLNNWGRIFVPPGSAIENILDLEGKTIALLRNDIHAAVLLHTMESFGVDIKTREYETYGLVMAGVEQGEADAGLVNRLFANQYGRRYQLHKTAIIFNPIDVRFAAPKGRNRPLLAVIDRHLARLKQDKNSFFYHTVERWIGEQGSYRLPGWVKWGVAAAALLLALAWTMIGTLRRLVRVRTRELAEKNRDLAEEKDKLAAEKNMSEAIMATMGDGLSIQDRDYRITYQNEVHKSLMGEHTGELCYQAYYGLDRICEECPVAMTFADEKAHTVLRHVRDEDRDFWVEMTASPLRDANGRMIAGIKLVRDVTARIRAEKEQRLLREQLLQAQKMESIGRLAGGIAHDFNNLLSSIIGYCELIELDLPADHPMAARIDAVHQAGLRAAELTGQLLACSRKQVLETVSVDCNKVIKGLTPMLERVIGEDIQLEVRHGQDLWLTEADPSQLEQVVMNLVVNARDAMPHGGQLVISTANILLDEEYARLHQGTAPGRYIMLAFSDSGMGMSDEVRERIFEPFFTTKEKGRGTGLGLATVYGIVQQHKGSIWVYSERGKGSTFKVYLPASDREEQRAPGPLPDISTMAGGHETILAVDDDAAIIGLISEVLPAQGYRVLTAASGEEALGILDAAEGEVDLLLTDVVMPGMNGRQLAEEFRRRRPHGAVVFMSGYADNHIVLREIKDIDMLYLQKPVTPRKILAIVRAALDRR